MSGAKPRILYLAHRVPHPPDKGDRIRNFHVLRELTRIADVDLACLADEPVSEATHAKLNELCTSVEIVPAAGRARWLRAAGRLVAGRSLSEGLFAEKKLTAWISQHRASHPWQAVVVSASSMAPYLVSLAGIPRFVDLVDVDSQKWFDYAAANRSPKKWLYRLEGRRVRQLEIELATWADAITIVSRAECDVFDSFTSPGRGTVATNGVDLDYFSPSATPTLTLPRWGRGSDSSPSGGGRVGDSFTPALAFVGALDYFPNVDGATWFAHSIWPEIHRRNPAAQFRIIGRNPVPAVQKLAAIPGVKIVGAVPDVRPHVASAMLAVCPIRIARGLQNKVLEAMALGVATLAAPAAIQALAAVPGVHLESPKTEAEWIETTTRLLADDARRRELGNAGRRFVEEHHHWDRCLQPLIDAVRTRLA